MARRARAAVRRRRNRLGSKTRGAALRRPVRYMLVWEICDSGPTARSHAICTAHSMLDPLIVNLKSYKLSAVVCCSGEMKRRAKPCPLASPRAGAHEAIVGREVAKALAAGGLPPQPGEAAVKRRHPYRALRI